MDLLDNSLVVYAIWITVLAAVCFYTLKLTTDYRNRDRDYFTDLVQIQSEQIKRLQGENTKLFEENIELRR